MCGYSNKENYYINYDSVNKYVDGIDKLVREKKIINHKEYYSSVRLKNYNDFNELKTEGIKYLELRNLDIFPFDKSGVDYGTLKFIHIFLIYLLFAKKNIPSNKERNYILRNKENISYFGGNNKIKIQVDKDTKKEVEEYSNDILEDMKVFYNNIGINKYNDLITSIIEKVKTSKEIKQGVLEYGYNNYIFDLSKKYKEKSLEKPYLLKGYEDLELSTQILIKDAYKKGYEVEILDRKENFISISNGIKKEYIVQATKTSLDNYASILMMENKVITKKILEENNINVAKGNNYENIEDAKKDFYLYKNKDIVIKPKSTNFGIGISILKGNYTKQEFLKGLEIAFKEEEDILIEEFLKGKEYRIFVIKDKVVGILHRVPANVKGDGKSNIKELVEEKNKNILRGRGYKTPLEKISLGEEEKLFLEIQGLDFLYIPKKDEVIYLRENSNISTGGDSLDFTDEIHNSYKKLAVKSSEALDVKICGVDMMIENINTPATKNNYGIIELNFNPAIHIHCFPFKGKNRKLGEKILNLLF